MNDIWVVVDIQATNAQHKDVEPPYNEADLWIEHIQSPAYKAWQSSYASIALDNTLKRGNLLVCLEYLQDDLYHKAPIVLRVSDDAVVIFEGNNRVAKHIIYKLSFLEGKANERTSTSTTQQVRR